MWKPIDMVPKLIINMTPRYICSIKKNKKLWHDICKIPQTPQKLPNNALHNTLPVKKRETFVTVNAFIKHPLTKYTFPSAPVWVTRLLQQSMILHCHTSNPWKIQNSGFYMITLWVFNILLKRLFFPSALTKISLVNLEPLTSRPI